MKLIIPVAGLSTRFSNVRPKYLLTFPDGELMLEKSIIGLDLNTYDEIIVVTREEHSKYFEKEGIENLLTYKTNIPVVLHEIKNSSSQADTCMQVIRDRGITSSIAIKDCDNSFAVEKHSGDSVAYVSLNSSEISSLDSPSKKSYLEFDGLGKITEIAEKNVISSNFCCGYYSFESADKFMSTTMSLLEHFNELNIDQPELYLTHVISDMIANGSVFDAVKATKYQDFGTPKAFEQITRTARTYFCDFDGVLVKNSGKFSKKPWAFDPIEENLKALKRKLSESPYSQLIITTSRPMDYEDKIRDFLLMFSIQPFKIVCGLPHCKRILINDYSYTNQYPTCEAINVLRDSNKLSIQLNT